MSTWESDGNYGRNLLVKALNGSIYAHVRVDASLRKRDITYDASVKVVTEQVAEYPQLQQGGFTSFREAEAWCEQAVTFFAEFLELRRINPILRQQNQEQFQEIVKLKEELHEYRYPHTIGSLFTK